MSAGRPLPPEELIERLYDLDDGLSEWELGFIARMDERLAAGLVLSAGMYEKLWEIFIEKA